MAPDPAGAVVLDIGGEVGAAVVHAPAALAGAEVEIRPAGGEWDGTHVAVHPRRVGTGTVHAAVFPAVAEGEWEVRPRGGGPVVRFAVTGGSVTTVSLG